MLQVHFSLLSNSLFMHLQEVQLLQCYGRMKRMPVCAGTLPPVQKAVLCLLPTLAPADAPALWPDFLSTLLDLLRPELLPSEGPGPADAGRARGGGGGEAASAGDRCGGRVVCGVRPIRPAHHVQYIIACTVSHRKSETRDGVCSQAVRSVRDKQWVNLL